VLFPPFGVDDTGPLESVPGLPHGFLLTVSRLLRYKHVDAVVAALSRLPHERLVVVGTGPELDRLRQRATPNVTLLGEVSDEQLRWLYSHAGALVAAAYEDFGLAPLEAAAFGTPTVALRSGGYLDTVIEGRTGLFFDAPEPEPIVAALTAFRATHFEPPVVRERAGAFNEARFRQELTRAVNEESGERAHG
jgi:glycosyltransferase involved in cell wall biosynthesis